MDYVSEVMVVGVPDVEWGQRVGAVVTLLDGKSGLSIEELRRDLRQRLAGYKLPTLLRVVEGDLPRSATGKLAKKVLGPKYFPQGYEATTEVQAWKSKTRTANL